MIKHVIIASAVIAAMMSTTASAGELIVHTVSWHTEKTHTKFGQPAEYNNTNPGIGYRTDSQWAFGMYRNSYNDTTGYLAKGFHLWKPVYGVVGVATGYEAARDGKKVIAFAGIELRAQLTDTISASALIFPPISSDDAGVVSLAFGIKY